MACNCKSGTAANRSRTPIVRPITSTRATNGGIAAAKTPTEVRNQSMTPPTPVNAAGINLEKRRVQALRRDAIRKSLNK